MMLSAFIWALNIFLFNGLPALRLLQIKDYHWARIKAHFYQPSSKNLIFNIKEIAIYIFLFLTLFLKNIYLNLWPGIITLLIFLIWRKNLKNYLVWTAKASLLALVQIFILTLLLSFSQVSLRSVLFLSLFIVQLIIITSVSEIINHTLKILSYPFRKKIKEKIIKAKKELGTMSILIVGSYGKSSVKHYLVEILQKLSSVCAPPERVNHEFALIKFFMKREIKEKFIAVEHGCYEVGQISFVSSFLLPDVGIITGITEQHFAVFGSMSKILRGEGYEILENMNDGLLIVNLNHNYKNELMNKIEELMKTRNVKLITYGTTDADYNFEVIERDLEKSKIRLKAKDETVEIEVPIPVPFQIENLVGAIALLHQFFSLEKILSCLKEIKILEKSMSFRKVNDILIFDASYNANPRGVLEAIKFLKSLPGENKFIIFNSLIELGKFAKKVFSEIAEESKFVNIFLSTFEDYDKILKEKLGSKFLLVKKRKELELFIKTIPRGSIVLILGRPKKEFADVLP